MIFGKKNKETPPAVSEELRQGLAEILSTDSQFLLPQSGLAPGRLPPDFERALREHMAGVSPAELKARQVDREIAATRKVEPTGWGKYEVTNIGKREYDLLVLMENLRQHALSLGENVIQTIKSKQP